MADRIAINITLQARISDPHTLWDRAFGAYTAAKLDLHATASNF